MNTEKPRYKNKHLQKKWEDAIQWLREHSRDGWVLDKKVTKNG